MPALLVDRNRNSTSRRNQYRKVGLQEAIPRLASIVDELRATRKLSFVGRISIDKRGSAYKPGVYSRIVGNAEVIRFIRHAVRWSVPDVNSSLRLVAVRCC